jgi:hypothetical protein
MAYAYLPPSGQYNIVSYVNCSPGVIAEHHIDEHRLVNVKIVARGETFVWKVGDQIGHAGVGVGGVTIPQQGSGLQP